MPQKAVAHAPLTPSLLYDILLGEIAGQRGRMDVSAPAYIEAARSSEDPRVAERALKIAVFGKQQKLALEAAKRWVALAPENMEARQAYAALALRDGDEDGARAQLDYLIKHSERSRDQTYQALLSMLAREPDKQRALAVMAKLVDERPNDADARYTYARLASHNENWPLALEQVNRALSLRPDWAQAIILRARIQLKQGKREEARAQMQAALKRKPDDLPLRLAYARLLVDLEDLKGAHEQYRKLYKMKPDNGQVVYSLALLSLETGDLKEAERYFQRLLELDFQKQQAYYYLGAIEEDRENYKKAFAWYSKVDKGDQWLEVQIRMARIEAETGRLDEARARLRNLRLSKPAQAHRLLLVEGELLSSLDKDNDAYALYSQYLDSQPDDIDVLYARSLVAERLDRLDVSESDLKKVLKKDPDNARALNALGYTLADRTTRYQEALQYIEKALAKTPEDPAVLDSMGWVQFKLGNLQSAREYLQKAYDKTEDVEIAAHLGEVLWAQGDQAAARALWDKASKKDPDDRVLKETLQRFLH